MRFEIGHMITFAAACAAAAFLMAWGLPRLMNYGFGNPPRKIGKSKGCTWWDHVHHAKLYKSRPGDGRSINDMPGTSGPQITHLGCPHCGAEVETMNESVWWERVDEQGPEYRKRVKRARGKCFASYSELADHLTIGSSPFTTTRN